MATITLDYNVNSILANSLIQVLRHSGEFAIHEQPSSGTYDPEFVDEILAADKSKGKRMKVEDIWN